MAKVKDITPKYDLIALKYKVVLPDNTGFGTQIGGLGTRLASTVSESINASGELVSNVVNSKLDTSTNEILGDFTFGGVGAIKMITDADNGLWISPTGILAKKAGATTLAITTGGDVTLVGTITATTGSIGGWTISSNAIYLDGSTDSDSSGMASSDYPFYAGKKYVDRATAPFRVTPDGALTATSATITGTINISNPSDIDGSTITNDSSWTDDTTADTAIANADTAQTAADDAQGDATTALNSLTDIALDSKITPVEKLTLLPIWGAILAEKITIDAQADVYSVSKVSYGTAYDNLFGYVVTSLNTFASVTTTTTIVRATWDGYFTAYYEAKVDILNSIADATALLADWASVTGTDKPSDNADVTSTVIDGGLITTGYITLGTAGNIKSGQTAYDTGTGFWIGSDGATPKLSIGDSTGHKMTWDGSVLAINESTITKPIFTGVQPGSEIAIQGWQSTLVLASSDYRTVGWSAANNETITILDGTVYTITAGNTGSMAALTYIYLDIAVSTTALQTTTTAATAVGTGKILIGVAQNNSDTSSSATYQVYGGSGGQLMTVDNIAANSASTNEFISNTAQIKDATITNAKINDLSVAKLTAGTISSKAITLAVAAGTGDTKLQAGMTDFGDSVNSGFILGIDDSDSDLPKFYIGDGADSSKLMYWDGTELVVNDSTISRNDIFGDGSDGNVTVNSNTTMSADWYCDNLTVDSGFTLSPGGYRLFVKNILTNNGTISRLGNAGGNGASGTPHSYSGGVGGTAGSAIAAGFFAAGVAGTVGGAGGAGGIIGAGSGGSEGAVGTASTNSLGTNGDSGNAGGAGGAAKETSTGSPSSSGGGAGSGGAGGTATAATTKPKTLTETLLMRNFEPSTPTKLNVAANTGAGGGGGGGGGFDTNPQSVGGGGGGAGGVGSVGGIATIFAKRIINAGTISTLGGAGGDGGNGNNGEVESSTYASGGGGGGAGGSGGSGGILVLVYNSLTNTGTITVAGGTGGTGGTGGIAGVGTPNTYPAVAGIDGNTGATGASGVLIQLQC